MSDGSPPGQLPQAALKALTVLSCFDRGHPEHSAAALGARLGMRSSTLYRYLAALESTGYIRRVPGSARYTLGLRAVELGGIALSGLEVHRHAQPVLESLADALGLNTTLAVLDQGDTFHLAFAVRNEVDTLYAVVGRRTPAHVTALGKVLLAHEEWRETRRAIEQYGWRPITPHSIRDYERLGRDLDDVRARGYAVDRGENHVGTVCVGAPVRERGGHVIAAISCTGPADALGDDHLTQVAREVVRHAERLSLRLGHSERAHLPG